MSASVQRMIVPLKETTLTNKKLNSLNFPAPCKTAIAAVQHVHLVGSVIFSNALRKGARPVLTFQIVLS